MSQPAPPGKHPELIVHTREPLNAEPPLERLAREAITPTELFYVRSHAPAPAIDPAGYLLSVAGLVERPLAFSLDALQQSFPERTLAVTLQCAGNRRADLQAVAPIPGEVPWGHAAIGNAVWTGVPLAAVLAAAGVRAGARYVEFLGHDETERDGARHVFGGSIPLEQSDHALLAYGMNGAPLAREHGFPLRAVVPGTIGARSVKWLAAIRLLERPSDNFFQARSYRLFPPAVRPETPVAERGEGLALGELPVNSAITTPRAGEQLPAGPLTARGYAISGGRPIVRVDVTLDGGASWRQATLLGREDRWTWRCWELALELPPGAHTLAVRAWDSAANTQPEDARALWNVKGYMNNAWHRVRFGVGT
jgi:sulfite oxidase